MADKSPTKANLSTHEPKYYSTRLLNVQGNRLYISNLQAWSDSTKPQQESKEGNQPSRTVHMPPDMKCQTGKALILSSRHLAESMRP